VRTESFLAGFEAGVKHLGRVAAFAACLLCVAALCSGLSSAPSNTPPVTPPATDIDVSISPSSVITGIGSNLQFTASVTGSSNTKVRWEVNGNAGGNTRVGTIDSTGLYIAPVTVPNVAIVVRAVAQANDAAFASASVTVTPTDPLGKATASAIDCPDSSSSISGSCYAIDISCPEIADFTAYAKVTSPSNAPLGTVMFSTGGNGSGLYQDYTYGTTAVEAVLQAGYTIVQTSFGGPFNPAEPDGWQTGPGGIRRAACRYATLARWVYDNINLGGASEPLCATGESAGGQLIGESLAHYGLRSIFTMVEPTSGPTFSRLDYACICDAAKKDTPCGEGLQSQCLSLSNAQNFVDPAYSSPICSSALSTHSTANQAQFLSDSVQSPDATLAYPETYVNFVFGGQDKSSAVTLGQDWQSAITTKSSIACVADAPHDIADVLDGAQQIANDLVTNCHLQ
jgi:hypothetical protein